MLFKTSAGYVEVDVFSNDLMTQDELWLAKWQAWKPTIGSPLSLCRRRGICVVGGRHNKKLMNAGELKPERLEMFKQLLDLGDKYRHVNQYQ